MSRRRKSTSPYSIAYTGLLCLRSSRDKKTAPGMQVEKVDVDFERTLWRTISQVFVMVSMFWCAFHFTHRIFRKIKKLGLARKVCYHRNKTTQWICGWLMCLHLLPYQKISRVFKLNCREATSQRVIFLLRYTVLFNTAKSIINTFNFICQLH